ncbi:MAG: hypothetical protein ACLUD2_13225 [Clostridium sp.]
MIAGSFIIGMIPMIFLYVLFWLLVIEKGTPILHIIIIRSDRGSHCAGGFCRMVAGSVPMGTV